MTNKPLLFSLSILSALLLRCGDDTPGGGTAIGGSGTCTNSPSPTEHACAIDERFAIFVVRNDDEKDGDGSRQRPYGSIPRGLDRAAADHKRLYVCATEYADAVTLRNGVSMFGNFTCKEGVWRASETERAHIVVRGAAAVTATDISAETRVEGFDIVGQAAAAVDSSNAVGFLAVRSPTLVLANVALRSEQGRAGGRGVSASSLSNDATLGAANANNAPSYPVVDGAIAGKWSSAEPKALIVGYTCVATSSSPYVLRGAASNACSGQGANGRHGGAGGVGSRGSWWIDKAGNGTYELSVAAQAVVPPAATAETAAPGTSGAKGADGTPGVNGTIGVLDVTSGFQVASGTNGADGLPGQGGGGGSGDPLEDPIAPTSLCKVSDTGGGGGAGGCPGLGAKAGTGGGGSFALIAIESPLRMINVALSAGDGGAGGAGGFGSFGQPGGKAGQGTKTVVSSGGGGQRTAGAAGGAGGAGGDGGSGGNGAGGHSIALAYRGGVPQYDAQTTFVIGKGGEGVATRSQSNPDKTSATMVIPASPAGLAEKVYEFH